MKESLWREYAGPDGFWGYGTPFESAKIAFVGLEFGGGKDKKDVAKRIDAAKSAKNGFVDAHDFFRIVDGEKNFLTKGSLIVRTFSCLLAALLGTKEREERKNYLESFGSVKAGVAWADLSALPCRSKSHEDFRNLYDLDRDYYETKYLPGRIRELQARIGKFKGEAVVLYGFSPYWLCLGHFQRIGEFKGLPIFKLENNGPSLYLISHPNRHGVPLDYFVNFGSTELKKARTGLPSLKF